MDSFRSGLLGEMWEAAVILPTSPEPVPVQPVGLHAGNSSCLGSCESLSWHMPSKALIIDVYCIAHMCCTWQPARELKAARVLYLSCYLKNQIICISFWHCFFPSALHARAHSACKDLLAMCKQYFPQEKKSVDKLNIKGVKDGMSFHLEADMVFHGGLCQRD